MAERVLTERELNRALLARQLLLERASMPLTKAVERVGGLQTQNAPQGYISLWSRLEGFARDDLTRSLEARSLVQGTLMRSTIHTVTAADYPLIVAGVRAARRESWIRGHRRAIPAETVAEAASRARPLLSQPRGRRELMAELGVDNVMWNGIGLWTDILRAPPAGTWERRRADIYVAADAWIDLPEHDPEDGLEHLLRRHLGGFGPAALRDIADWAGVPPATLAPIVERVRVRRFRDERGTELLDLPRAPLPDPQTPAPVRFLPTWDATLLVHARRTQILPERFRPRVFSTRTPQSVPTFLVDGQVAGTWKHERGRVTTEPFEPLPAAARRDVAAEADRLAEFMA